MVAALKKGKKIDSFLIRVVGQASNERHHADGPHDYSIGCLASVRDGLPTPNRTRNSMSCKSGAESGRQRSLRKIGPVGSQILRQDRQGPITKVITALA